MYILQDLNFCGIISVPVWATGSRWTSEKHKCGLVEAEERQPPGPPDSAA